MTVCLFVALCLCLFDWVFVSLFVCWCLFVCASCECVFDCLFVCNYVRMVVCWCQFFFVSLFVSLFLVSVRLFVSVLVSLLVD